MIICAEQNCQSEKVEPYRLHVEDRRRGVIGKSGFEPTNNVWVVQLCYDHAREYRDAGRIYAAIDRSPS